MDRYDPYTDKFLRDTQYNIHGTNLAEVGTDCISRQQTIDALCNYLVGKNVPCDGTLTCRLIENEVVNKLPSALGTDLAEVGTDCISRQAAIDVMAELQGRASTKAELKGISKAWKIIKKLPPTEPQERTGKWIQDRSGAYCCSECMEPCATYVMMKPRDKYCKMCGSRNEVTE